MTQETIQAQAEWRVFRGVRDSETVVLERPSTRGHSGAPQVRAVKTAVLAHIRALRALGNTRANTNEIARALGLSRSLVEQVVGELRDEGVKVLR